MPVPTTNLTQLSAANVAFSPADKTVEPGHENYGRYMLQVPWSRRTGWGQPTISPRAKICMDPLAGVMQYAVTCFEGMKCYKTADDELRLFRPTKNLDRFKRSAARLGLPYDWDNEELLDLIGKLVSLDRELAPSEDGGSLYIRPTIVETSPSFGIKDDAFAEEALIYVVTTANLGKGLYGSVDGPGLKLDACSEIIRAWPGGHGSFKLGANYGTTSISKKPGYAMSLWLHGQEDFISEAGAMNVFVLREAQDGYLEFVTMSLDNGIVLPGVTRASLIEMVTAHAEGKEVAGLQDLPRNLRVVERDVSMNEIVTSLADGSLKGMFGCGTGVVVVAIGEITYKGENYKIPSSPVVKVLRDTMTALQRGKIEHEWSWRVPEWHPVAK